MFIMLCNLLYWYCLFCMSPVTCRICCWLLQAFNDEEDEAEAREVSETLSPMLLSRIRDLAVAR